MGCCKESRPARLRVSCEWKGKREVLVFSNLRALREAVRGPFPELRFKAFGMFIGNVEVRREEQVLGAGKAEVNVTIIEQPCPKFTDETWTAQAQSVFLLLDATTTTILGTGVALNANIALCTIQNRPNQDLSAVFPADTSTIHPLKPPIWSLSLSSIYMSLREFPSKLPFPGLIELNTQATDHTDVAWVLYVSSNAVYKR